MNTTAITSCAIGQGIFSHVRKDQRAACRLFSLSEEALRYDDLDESGNLEKCEGFFRDNGIPLDGWLSDEATEKKQETDM